LRREISVDSYGSVWAENTMRAPLHRLIPRLILEESSILSPEG